MYIHIPRKHAICSPGPKIDGEPEYRGYHFDEEPYFPYRVKRKKKDKFEYS